MPHPINKQLQTARLAQAAAQQIVAGIAVLRQLGQQRDDGIIDWSTLTVQQVEALAVPDASSIAKLVDQVVSNAPVEDVERQAIRARGVQG